MQFSARLLQLLIVSQPEIHSRTQQIQDTAATSIRIGNEMVERLQRQATERDSLRQQNAELEATAKAAISDAEGMRMQILELEKSANTVDDQRSNVVERLRNSIAENESLKRQLRSDAPADKEHLKLKAQITALEQSLSEREQQLKEAREERKEAQLVHDSVTITDISGAAKGSAFPGATGDQLEWPC